MNDNDPQTIPAAVPASPPSQLLPGATIGVLGSGQLGRMLALEARRLGYRIATYSPERDTPTSTRSARS